MEAGGPSEFGTLKRVRLMRVVNGVQKSQVMDLHEPKQRGETFLRARQ